MKTLVYMALGLIFCTSVSAQVYTMNWGTSFSPAWANGATSRTAFNIGGSGINCSVNVAKSGGVFASSSGISAPTVTYSLVTVPGSAKNLMVALDYSSSSQYCDITFTFTAVVYDLSFVLADIDRLTNTSNSYYDRITITGSIGATSVQPNITKYDPTTDPAFLVLSGNRARVNTGSGKAGNTASDATDQKGTIKVDFNGKTVTSVTIRYDNQGGVASDPGLQFIGIGNLSFRQSAPLAVQLTSFDGLFSNGKNMLRWTTASESEMAYYAVERSTDGADFREIGQVASLNTNTVTSYAFTDNSPGGNLFYRLKMLNRDGSFSYSKTVWIRSADAGSVPPPIQAFPSVFTSSLNIRLQSQKDESIRLLLVDLSGKTVFQTLCQARKGMNEFSMQLPAALPRGRYFVVAENTRQAISVTKQ